MKNNLESKRPVILVTNDDGYTAPGIRKLIEVARTIGKVIVVAGEKSMSGQGHAITISTPLRIKTICHETDYEEYVTNGTPVDCIKLGEQVIMKGKPDLVVSGVNHGSNASINVIYSGTMAAVLEACIDYIPAIGFSLLDYEHDADFSHTGPVIESLIKKVLLEGLPNGICLNVNIPAISTESMKGVRVCRQAHARWVEEFDSRFDPRGGGYHWLTGKFENDDMDEDTDVWALENNYVSVVPVQYDMTAYKSIELIKQWNLLI